MDDRGFIPSLMQAKPLSGWLCESRLSTAARRLAWRSGRRLYCWARGDPRNDPANNGEYWLLEQVLCGSARDLTLLDVGANVGDWTIRALTLASVRGKRIHGYAFEPCTSTREILEHRLKDASDVEICAFALSSAEGEADFFSSGPGIGTNSLGPISGTCVERVRLTTIDKFLERNEINRVDLLKIDAEGFDCSVLEGAARSLVDGKIDVVQFEYNWRWVVNKASLHRVFTLIQGMPYRLGKLVGPRIVFFDVWHFELERFFENNYVLIRHGSAVENLGCEMEFDSSNSARPKASVGKS